MKKVLMMLFALLALFSSCRKEDVPQSDPKSQQKSQPKSQTVQLSLSADISGARALDFKIKGGKVKLDLEGKDELPVWTFIYKDGEVGYASYAKVLKWKVSEDKKRLFYQGSIDTYSLSGGSTYRLKAVILQEEGVTLESGEILKIPTNIENKIQVASDTKPASFNVPYIMETNLVYASGTQERLYNDTQPAQEKHFKPLGNIIRMKIKNTYNRAIKIDRIRQNYFFHKEIWLSLRHSNLQAWEHTFPGTNFGYREVDFSEGPVTVAANSLSDETFLIYMPTIYGKEPDEDGFQRSRFELVPSSSEKFDNAYYTTHSFSKPKADYQSGKVYDVVLTLRALPNPLDLISEAPVDKTHRKFVDAPASGNYDDTFNDVGYFTYSIAEAYFMRPKTYGNGGSDKWVLPTEHQYRTIFPYMSRGMRTKPTSADYRFEATTKECIDLAGYYFYGKTYLMYAERAGSRYLDMYALRFCPIPADARSERLYEYFSSDLPGYNKLAGGTRSFQWHGSQGIAENDNRMRYAFRYRYDKDKKLLIVQSKYIGDDPTITQALDIMDPEYGGIIDWETVATTKRTFPLYGAKYVNQATYPNFYESEKVQNGLPPHGCWASWLQGSDKGPLIVDRTQGRFLCQYFGYTLRYDSPVSTSTIFFLSNASNGGANVQHRTPNSSIQYQDDVQLPVYLFKQLN